MEITTINPFEQSQMVEAIASVYQQSFGGEPWNEGYVCPVCEKMFALKLGVKTCPACTEKSQTVLVVEYWPMHKIITDFYREMRKPDPICVVARSNEEVVGFAWGYRVSANPDLDEHLDAQNLHQSLHGDFFYLDECALVPACQGKGVGKLLVSHILREQRQRQIILRTMDDSRMCHLIKHLGGEILQSISRERCIMRLATP
jgi:GNAT superfamily N-acetyltransferase